MKPDDSIECIDTICGYTSSFSQEASLISCGEATEGGGEEILGKNCGLSLIWLCFIFFVISMVNFIIIIIIIIIIITHLETTSLVQLI